MNFRTVATALAALALPGPLKIFVLRLLRHRLGPNCRIGWNVLLVDRLSLEDGVRIGSFNFIQCRRLVVRTGGYIESFNFVRGPLSILLGPEAGIGRRNQISRAGHARSVGPASLMLGQLSKITSGHKLDCTRSIRLGEYSTVAGLGSQLWTHGYYHFPTGPGRIRVDGKIVLGNNVYVGSACVVSLGVQIADGIMVGSHSSVSKSLTERGLYVSQPLRRVDLDLEATMRRLRPIGPKGLPDRVFERNAS
jgi:acetyltransferase-like isoleucine patch superfamily enzyme